MVQGLMVARFIQKVYQSRSALIDAQGKVNDVDQLSKSGEERGLDPVEAAIRNALERGDATDPAYRERVYRSALAALERSIAGRAEMPAEVAERRRAHLRSMIGEVETEFEPATEAAPARPQPARTPPVQSPPAQQPSSPPNTRPAAPPVDAPRVTPAAPPLRRPAAQAPQPRVEPPIGAAPQPARPAPEPTVHMDTPPAQRATRAEPDLSVPGSLLTEEDLALDDEPVVSRSDSLGGDFAPAAERRDYGRPQRRRGKGIVAALVLLVLLALAGISAWMMRDADIFGASRLSQARNATEPAGVATPSAEEEGWITVFSPSDPTTASARSGATAEVVTQGGDKLLKISSTSGEQTVDFRVGAGILEKLAGSQAVFDIIARSEDGEKTQISVSCDLGGLGDCGRSRFEVGGTISDYLVRTELSGGTPSEGTISIVPDVTGKGKALEILRIRAQAEN